MSLFEKVVILGSLGMIGCGTLYAIINPTRNLPQKEDIQKKRHEILNNPDVRILYSSMTFFYLQGFHQKKIDSLFTLYDIISISKPKIVALQLSESDYNENYKPIVQNPQFQHTMKKVDYLLKTKDPEIKNIKDIDLENLEKFYLLDYCKQNKCQVLFADLNNSQLASKYNAKIRIQEQQAIPSNLIDIYQNTNLPTEAISKEQIYQEIYVNQRSDYYVDCLMDQLKPQWSILPSSPYKTIIGVVEPQFVKLITKQWKNKFKQTYGHQILEDESVKQDDEI